MSLAVNDVSDLPVQLRTNPAAVRQDGLDAIILLGDAFLLDGCGGHVAVLLDHVVDLQIQRHVEDTVLEHVKPQFSGVVFCVQYLLGDQVEHQIAHAAHLLRGEEAEVVHHV